MEFINQLRPGEIFLINKHLCVNPEDVEFWSSAWVSKIEILEAAGPLITRLLWKKSYQMKTVRWTPETADPVIKSRMQNHFSNHYKVIRKEMTKKQ